MMRSPRPSTTSAPQSLDPNVLILQFGPTVWAICRRLSPDPEDAYQDVWEHLLVRLHRYDLQKGAIRPWILTVTHRHLVDRHRRRTVRGVTLAAVDIVSDGPAADDLVALRQGHERLERAIQNLPQGQRRIVVMHHIHGQELSTIAENEGLPMGTIKSRLHRGRALLARQLTRLS
ncbi:MAG: RNA polymerase sigma-70 factor (ECF subfamily) [Kiritimatiellia bacterium]|jgi:RNA polymerase sigma-70 factor (ECF subfamily)